MKKKKDPRARLSLDKETLANLNADKLSLEQGREIEGGVTAFTSVSCFTFTCSNTYTAAR